MSFKKTGNYYVDKTFGNDATGTGTKENPFFTANKAATVAARGQTVILGPGVYEEIIAAGYGVNYVADGYVLFIGTKIIGSAFAGSVAALIDGVHFFDWRGPYIAVNHSPEGVQADAKLKNCRFDYCNIRVQAAHYSSSPASSSVNIKHCVFRHCLFSCSNTPSAAEFQNNTLDICEGLFAATMSGAKMVNNIFRNCTNLQMPYGSQTQVIPVAGEFDFNQIEGNLNGWNLAQWQANASWSNANSFAMPPADYLNDFNDTRNDLSYWRSDYSLRSVKADGVTLNPLINSGKFGRFIGAFPRGFKFSAAYIWANKASSSNLIFDAATNTLKLDSTPGPLTGVIETNILPIALEGGGDESITLDRLKFFQNIVWSLIKPGTATQFIDTATDPAPNALVDQKTIYDIEAAFFSDAENPTVWQKFEIENPMRLDSMQNGYGERNFDLETQTLITANWVKLRLTFKRL